MITFAVLMNVMKKETLQTFLICAIISFLSGNITAQSTLNTTSGGVEINNNSFEYSIGEMILVSTFDAGATRLTQGFLQPAEAITISVETIAESSAMFSVYPNPSQGFLQLSTQGINDGMWTIALHDASGRLIHSYQYYFTAGVAQSLDLTDAAAGCYFLKIYSKERIETPFETIRLIKY
jgi:hypothetical protein